MAWLVIVLLVALSLLGAWVQVLQRDVIELKSKMLKIDPQYLQNRHMNHERRIAEVERRTGVKR